MRFTIKTYGCQMNVYDSRRISEMMRASGHEEALLQGSDVLVLNTCSVREKPREKVIAAIRQAKSENPNLKVVIAGCVAQLEGDALLEHGADLVVGPDWYGSLSEALSTLDGEEHRAVFDGFITENPEFLQAHPTDTGVSVFLPIQKGCDNFCTYCVVPMARGPERSRDGVEILDEVARQVASGAKEIFLLGQNVNSYKAVGGFPGLLKAVAGVPGVERVRFTTSHPKDLSNELIEVMAIEPKVAPWLHLPVQSGADSVLKRMGRGYTRKDYLSLVRRLKSRMPHLAITTDMIVGFPGETDDDFQDTMDLVKQVGYEGMYSFKYSERPGTAALKLDGAVPESVRAARLRELQSYHEGVLPGLLERYTGERCEVLVEGASARDAGEARGRIPQNHVVNFSLPEGVSPETLVGKMVSVEIIEVRTHTLYGKMVKTL